MKVMPKFNLLALLTVTVAPAATKSASSVNYILILVQFFLICNSLHMLAKTRIRSPPMYKPFFFLATVNLFSLQMLISQVCFHSEISMKHL